MAEIDKLKKQYKDQLGLDITKSEDRLFMWNEVYKRDTKKFINDLVKIEDKDSADVVIPFDLWEGQEQALDLFLSERFVICLKTRQIGFSWLALSGISHEMVYKPGFTATVITQTEKNSKEMIRRVDFILRHLPNWLIYNQKAEDKDKQKQIEENITGISFTTQTLSITIHHPNGEDSVFKGATSSASSAHGFTDNWVILDEWARHPEAEDIWEAAYPTINRPTGGKVIGISTGMRNTFFEDMWNDANWEFGAEKGGGANLFTGIFLPWDTDPRRDREWYENTKKNMKNFKSQYPSTPSEAFSVGSGAMFTEWDSKIHAPYGKEWYPPASWRIICAYDGGYNRAAFGWYAVAPDGWVVKYREYYPACKTDPEQAEDIRMLSRDSDGVPEQIDYIVADTSCWGKNKDTGKTTIEIMEDHGIRPWRQADKERIMGWKRLHEFLKPIKDEEDNFVLDRYGDPLAKLRFTESCSNFIRLVPGIKVHPQKPDDIDNGQEDHIFDETRYFIQSRPRANVSVSEKRKMNRKRKEKTKPRSSVTGY